MFFSCGVLLGQLVGRPRDLLGLSGLSDRLPRKPDVLSKLFFLLHDGLAHDFAGTRRCTRGIP